MADWGKLARSSLKIIREEGIGAFVGLLAGWLRGERGQYHPEEKPPTYAEYIRATEPPDLPPIKSGPRFAIVTSGAVPRRTLDSVLAQTYPHWRWYADLNHSDERIIKQATPNTDDDYVVTLEAGDTLAPFALAALAAYIEHNPGVDYIYSDVDTLDADGTRRDPWFKPDWSPETHLSADLLAHLGACRRNLWQPYHRAFGLQIGETAKNIAHLPIVLYHRRADAPQPDDLDAIAAHLRHTGLEAPQVTHDPHGAIDLRWQADNRRVSVIIPSKDQPALIGRCLESLFKITAYPDYEVILVDTGSVDPATWALYARYADEPRFKQVDYDEPFNFSRACNVGAGHATGVLLLFLNNDTEILHADWLTRMAMWFEREKIGVVGAKLLYPDGRIQHAGVIIGLFGLAAHLFALDDDHSDSMIGSVDWYRNYLAVTGACLMIPRALFDQIGGFEEAYQLNYSDVELCLRAIEAGYRVVYTPHVRLLHHESATHQKRIPIKDTDLFNQRLREWLRRGDPFYNPNLSYRRQHPTLKFDADDNPENNNAVMIAALQARIQGDVHVLAEEQA